ncbi:hypothetical protein LZP85_00785 [Priestia flexa]|uniref:Uncharacterized protein n=1 Tax=Priestia flexa TaxID=86664 RepID=A0A8I1SP65_9BACI|nr:hypothetical protein [Priestia flexa]MBN8252830.1 hypothetical protein [Priestia flexa]MBN8435250.1 hypothetical protein [Priestia flexa]MCA0967832.1 hypothetical protein [Priestia flexa]UIR30397.1 hypothetical protein LZP85_00785 [Priestia flexa]
MTKAKWLLILLCVMDLGLVAMHLSGYFFLSLKPTGYVIPLVINMILLFFINKKLWVGLGLVVGVPALFIHGFMVLFMEYGYTKIDSPHDKRSLMIEYRHVTLGETTYFYHFYKTRFGIIGKLLDDQSVEFMVRGPEYPVEEGAEAALGAHNPTWISKDIVQFNSWKGAKDVYLASSSSAVSTKEIDNFILKAKSNSDGETITINGMDFITRYDKKAGQRWIDVVSDGDEGLIPRQQCSRIVRNEERGYYMLEECTHQWEYELYPLTDGQ